ncbi:MAG: hypothetical protein GW917_00485 [Bdellovibrionales bacterium]|nr:hypothetical protein [Bdellovibrionales bacterium]
MKADNVLKNSIGPIGANDKEPQGLKKEFLKGEFEAALKSLRESVQKGTNPAAPSEKVAPLKFSNHAIERMRARGLAFSPEQLARIEQGVDKAARKGAQNTLLISEGSALIVSVKNNTVVTVMDPNQMKDSVVTNIDSTVLV